MRYKKLLPRHHTGKLVHRHHTAYGSLLLSLALVILPLLTISTSAAGLSADPVTGNEGIYAVIAAPVPATAPVIKSITNGQTFLTAELVPISGSCPNDTVIKVYKNQVMAGSTLCHDGFFSVKIDLFLGANSIIARAYNSNNIPGPDPSPIDVVLNPKGSVSNETNQLFVTSDKYYQGVRTKDNLKWPITVSGGQPPYAINIGWGDGKSDLISRGQMGTFDIEHTYDKAGSGYKGSYDVTISVTDVVGTKSFIQFVAIVSDTSPSAVTAAKTGYNSTRLIRIAWQFFVATLAAIVIFWLGEQYEIRVLKKKREIAL